MTVLEAIASGRMFQRIGWANPVHVTDDVKLTLLDVQATDWVIFKAPVLITKDQLDKALTDAKADPKLIDEIYQSIGIDTVQVL